MNNFAELEITKQDDYEKYDNKHTNRELAVTFYQNERGAKPTDELSIGWDELIARLKQRDIRDNKSGSAFSGVRLFEGQRRSNENIQYVDMLIADIDTTGKKDAVTGRITEIIKAAPRFEDICDRFNDYEYFVYTTHGHDPDSGVYKYRIVFPLTRSVQPHEWDAVWEGFNNLLGGINDAATKDISRIFYMPSCPELYRGDAWYEQNEGEWIDPIDLIGTKPKGNSRTHQNTLAVELTDAPGNKVEVPFTFNENNEDFYNALCVAIPPGADREEWMTGVRALAYLVTVHQWPETEARKIREAWERIDKNADTSNNDKEWLDALKRTKDRRSSEIKVTTHLSILSMARANGWQPLVREASALSAAQAKYALIKLGGKVGIVDKGLLSSRTKEGGASGLEFINKPDGSLLIARFLTNGFPQADTSKILKSFMRDSGTTLYDGVEFNPITTTPHVLNLWIGPTIRTIKGNSKLIHEFILDVICGSRQADYSYLIMYIAHALQRPEEKPGAMVIMLGGQGIGKGTLGRMLRKIWSATYLQVGQIKRVVGDFNGPLERAFIVFLDEALFAGDKASSDSLKSLVTEPVLLINEKHQPARQIASYHRFFSATNADWFKSTDRDDRRDFVLRVSEHRKGDYKYWDLIAAEIEGPGLEAFAYDLTTMDLSKFNPRSPPKTRELAEQKIQSLERFPRWWYDSLYRGRFSSWSNGVWPEFVSTGDLELWYRDETKHVRSYRAVSEREIKGLIDKLCRDAVPGQKKDGLTALTKKRGYSIPPLEQARKNFEQYLGTSLEWDEVE